MCRSRCDTSERSLEGENVRIAYVRAICTAPRGIRLVIVKVETYCLAVPKMFEFVRSEFGPEVELTHDVHERYRP
jgi:hypothetical protein